MREKIWNVYLNKYLLIIAAVLSIGCYLADAIWAINDGESSYYAWKLMVLVILLLWSFFSGQINVQKMLFGAMLLAMVTEQVQILELDVILTGHVQIMDVCSIIIAVIVFFSHMCQQMEHSGKSPAIIINQLLGLTGILFLITAILNLIFMPTECSNYVFLFGYVFNCIMVICMETRVETYKQIRDKARSEGTWTEENRREAKKLFKLS